VRKKHSLAIHFRHRFYAAARVFLAENPSASKKTAVCVYFRLGVVSWKMLKGKPHCIYGPPLAANTTAHLVPTCVPPAACGSVARLPRSDKPLAAETLGISPVHPPFKTPCGLRLSRLSLIIQPCFDFDILKITSLCLAYPLTPLGHVYIRHSPASNTAILVDRQSNATG